MSSTNIPGGAGSDNGATPGGEARGRRPGRRRLLVVGAVLAVAGLGTAATVAAKHGPWAGGGPRFERMVEHRIDHALDHVEATLEQREAIQEKLEPLFAEFRDGARRMRAIRQDMARALAADPIDVQALEDLRADRIAAMDARSKRVLELAVSAADELTPVQRQALAERAARRWARHSERGDGPAQE